jgi:uncharacterized membrane protein
MARVVILLAVLAIGFILWFKFSKAKGAERKKLRNTLIIGSVIAVLIVMAVTGHLNAITAAIGGMIALLPKFAHLLRYLPIVNRIFQTAKNNNGQQQGQQSAQHNPGMTKDKAYDVLGLKPGASKEDIIAAHKKMMQKNHPDRGGSDYLAAEINTAKDTLLS